MKKIIIVDKVDVSLNVLLTERGCQCETIRPCSYEQFLALPDQYEGLIIRSAFKVDRALIDTKPNLKFIVRIGSGVENIDVAYATQQQIACISTPEGNAQAVAEHCLGFLLAAMRNIPSADSEVKKGIWDRERNKGYELNTLTVGIIGMGNNGKALAQLLQKLGCRVLAYDKYHPNFSLDEVENCSLETLQQQADVISIHVNYIPENHYFINSTFIHQLPHPILLINSSRGAVVDTKALLEGLQSGKIAHASLDVLEYESVKLAIPPKEKWDDTLTALAAHPNVTLTPHVAGQTEGSHQKHAAIAFHKLVALGLV